MYSTVTATLESGIHPMAALLKAFPMGSMTGAPKVRAMQILQELEHSKRGIYSGTVGFFDPETNGDFNVVIRSLVYDQDVQRLSCHAGGGITALSSPEAEYEESMVKARPIFDLLREYMVQHAAPTLPLADEGSID
jgi:para-aminobenzoate synthetase component 1